MDKFKTAAELRNYLDALEKQGSELYKKHGVTEEVKKIQGILCGPLSDLLDEMEYQEKLKGGSL